MNKIVQFEIDDTRDCPWIYGRYCHRADRRSKAIVCEFHSKEASGEDITDRCPLPDVGAVWPAVRYLTVDEIMKDAKPTDIFKKVQDEILRESAKNPIDEHALRRDQTWSALGDKVVGAE